MKAARFYEAGQPVAIEDVPEPDPGPSQVVVSVEACGICASDLHVLHGDMPLPVPPPLTMGHEPAGTIAALGSDVSGWRVGDRVALMGFQGCLRCDRCVAGRFEDCRVPQIMGIHYDGAWAERMVVPWYALARVPDGVQIEHAAIAADAISTPFAALTERGALRPGERVGLWGIGGLGTHALQIAKLAGASFIAAVDPLPEARERALALGADLALDPSEPVPDRIKEATGGIGLDLGVDLIGKAVAVTQAMHCLARGGRVVLVGQSSDRVQAGSVLVLSYLGLSLLGHLGYAKRHLESVLQLMASGRLDVSASINGTYGLDDVNDGVQRLTSKQDAPVRLVVLPQE